MPDLPKHTETHIRGYVEGQWKQDEDPVTLVQAVGSRRILHHTYEMFDVHCKESRWWVITDPMNLYSQEDFASIDMALTYHVGLRLMLSERDRRHLDEEREQGSQAWRRFEQAAETTDSASEAEDFQAVGIKCREALIALVHAHQNGDWIGTVESPPKRSDVKGWGAVFSSKLAKRRMRAYLGGLFETTWDLAVWLQHNKNATAWDADLLLEATSHLIATFDLMLHRSQQAAPGRCPRCDSYRVTTSYERVEQPKLGLSKTPVCGACGWRGDSLFDGLSARTRAAGPDRGLPVRASRNSGSGPSSRHPAGTCPSRGHRSGGRCPVRP